MKSLDSHKIATTGDPSSLRGKADARQDQGAMIKRVVLPAEVKN
ncbi:hypothetical protein [Haloferula sp.]